MTVGNELSAQQQQLSDYNVSTPTHVYGESLAQQQQQLSDYNVPTSTHVYDESLAQQLMDDLQYTRVNNEALAQQQLGKYGTPMYSGDDQSLMSQPPSRHGILATIAGDEPSEQQPPNEFDFIIGAANEQFIQGQVCWKRCEKCHIHQDTASFVIPETGVSDGSAICNACVYKINNGNPGGLNKCIRCKKWRETAHFVKEDGKESERCDTCREMSYKHTLNKRAQPDYQRTPEKKKKSR